MKREGSWLMAEAAGLQERREAYWGAPKKGTSALMENTALFTFSVQGPCKPSPRAGGREYGSQ